MAAPPRDDRFLVSEIYRTIQGEGTMAGVPTVFVRLYSCNLRCAWCDSMHAVEGGEFEDVDIATAVGRINALAGTGIHAVCWTGGEPLLQWRALARAVRDLPARFVHCVETDGEVPLPPPNDALTVARSAGRFRYIMDVKCPGSGMIANTAFENFRHLRPDDEVKFVLLDRTDYEFARGVVQRHDIPAKTILFSPVTAAHRVAVGLDPADVAAWILRDGLNVRLQLQLHKLIWPGKDRGV